jgi:hypothetical protein
VVNQDKRLVGMIALADLGRSGVSAAMKALGASPSRRTSRGDSGKKSSRAGSSRHGNENFRLLTQVGTADHDDSLERSRYLAIFRNSDARNVFA